MEILLLIPVSCLMGFFTAIPLGATQIEIAKRSLRGYLLPAVLVAIGSALSDIMYGFIAMFGIAPFLKDQKVMAVFWFLSAAVLIVLAFFTLRQHTKLKNPGQEESALGNNRLALFVGFSLASTNPPIIMWWLICAELIRHMGIVSVFHADTIVIFVLSFGLGIASYLTLLSFVLKRVGKFISKKTESAINISLGLTLILLSLYFLEKSMRVLV